jgi:hypothetical protein
VKGIELLLAGEDDVIGHEQLKEGMVIEFQMATNHHLNPRNSTSLMLSSDLDLVAEAMQSSTPTNGHPTNTVPSTLPPDIADALSTLSPSDLAVLQPLLAALTSNPSVDSEDGDLQDLLRQMDSATDIADSLEARLDNLLGTLGEAERELDENEDGEILGEEEKKAFGASEGEVREAKEVIESREGQNEE